MGTILTIQNNPSANFIRRDYFTSQNIPSKTTIFIRRDYFDKSEKPKCECALGLFWLVKIAHTTRMWMQKDEKLIIKSANLLVLITSTWIIRAQVIEVLL